ncbi:uncharacterized protein LOC131224254 [Magnolia sinica]|uniref:uncharacterized protein LOC131224254 n=1 Tax=Magnolia sinica TaxID=86752 RepID=UPI002659F8F2|nr:uncharacterized protein LOC131224254 [Magnolia sinica]
MCCRMLFELLVLTGAQVGMDWTSILRKCHDFRVAFAGFDAEIVANFTERQIASMATDCNMNLNKFRSVVNNANRILLDKFDLDLSVPHFSHAVDDMIKERFKDYRGKLFQALVARLPTDALPLPLSSLTYTKTGANPKLKLAAQQRLERYGEGNNNSAELQAVYDGLALCGNLGLSKVVVELDSKLVVDALKGQSHKAWK